MSETEAEAEGPVKPTVPVESWIPHPASDWMDWMDEDKKYPFPPGEGDRRRAEREKGSAEPEPEGG